VPTYYAAVRLELRSPNPDLLPFQLKIGKPVKPHLQRRNSTQPDFQRRSVADRRRLLTTLRISSVVGPVYSDTTRRPVGLSCVDINWTLLLSCGTFTATVFFPRLFVFEFGARTETDRQTGVRA